MYLFWAISLFHPIRIALLERPPGRPGESHTPIFRIKRKPFRLNLNVFPIRLHLAAADFFSRRCFPINLNGNHLYIFPG